MDEVIYALISEVCGDYLEGRVKGIVDDEESTVCLEGFYRDFMDSLSIFQDLSMFMVFVVGFFFNVEYNIE